ncbi:MAG TPA: site-2 protease family protein [Candidatus Eremiobacteraceae bacterium]|nr:site-2 protease family protein [Candidatus Eremiobacteraceae bacterium]
MRLRWTWRIGSIAGIDVGVHPSWLLVFTLFAYVASERSSLLGFDLPLAQRIALGLAVSLVLFASVIVHEFSHAFVARRQGIPIGNITLFLFGGVATILREPGTPMDEIRMATAGPLASVALAIIFGLVWVVCSAAGFIWGTAFAALLALANCMLAIFNMLPAFPSDGGRVLRALLWKATGSQARGTGFAAMISAGIATLLMLTGIWLAVTSFRQDPDWSLYLWPVIIGAFLMQAALASARQARINLALERMPITDCFAHKLISVPADMSVASFVSQLAIGDPSAGYAVVNDGRFVGLLSVRDTGGVPHSLWDHTPVSAVMTPAHRVPGLTTDAAACEGLAQLERQAVRELPVFDNGALTGVISHDTIFAALRAKERVQPT